MNKLLILDEILEYESSGHLKALREVFFICESVIIPFIIRL